MAFAGRLGLCTSLLLVGRQLNAAKRRRPWTALENHSAKQSCILSNYHWDGGRSFSIKCRANDPCDHPSAPPKSSSARRRRRLDEVCLELYPQFSRNVIQSWIVQGKVLVNDRPVVKAGASVPPMAHVTITAEQPKFVCRAGLKLEAALDTFSINIQGCRALDAGLSTGGFTDCLLQRGAVHVIGVDVGYGQVAEKIRTDDRVLVMERTNLRHLRRKDLPNNEFVDLVTLDVSFISSLKMIDTVQDVLKPQGDVVLLVKPQFEAGKELVSAGGVVKDPEVRKRVVDSVIAGWTDAGFRCAGVIESPVKGATSGNVEYLAHFTLP